MARICPISFIAFQGGIYYYYAKNCDTNQPTSMQSTTPFDPALLGCNDQNPYCEGESALAAGPAGANSIRSQIVSAATRKGGLPALTALDAPFETVPGVSRLVEAPMVYRMGTGNRFARLFLLAVTPGADKAGNPLPEVMIGVGQEVAPPAGETPVSLGVVESDGAYSVLHRARDDVYFHVLGRP